MTDSVVKTAVEEPKLKNKRNKPKPVHFFSLKFAQEEKDRADTEAKLKMPPPPAKHVSKIYGTFAQAASFPLAAKVLMMTIPREAYAAQNIWQSRQPTVDAEFDAKNRLDLARFDEAARVKRAMLEEHQRSMQEFKDREAKEMAETKERVRIEEAKLFKAQEESAFALRLKQNAFFDELKRRGNQVEVSTVFTVRHNHYKRMNSEEKKLVSIGGKATRVKRMTVIPTTEYEENFMTVKSQCKPDFQQIQLRQNAAYHLFETCHIDLTDPHRFVLNRICGLWYNYPGTDYTYVNHDDRKVRVEVKNIVAASISVESCEHETDEVTVLTVELQKKEGENFAEEIITDRAPMAEFLSQFDLL